ncbi:hypothetical protein C0993_011972, partial [Termitomyces sp. T159_Od127]
SVKIDGLGTQHFEDVIKSTGIVCNLFNHEFSEGRLERWEDAYVGQNNRFIYIANQIFMPKTEAAPDEVHYPMNKDLDPYRLSEKIFPKGFMITEDNIVQYSKAKAGENGKIL